MNASHQSPRSSSTHLAKEPEMKTKPGAWMARGGFSLLLAAAALATSGAALGAGTTAGTNITNKATLSYSVGTVNQSDIASSPSGSTNGTGANTTFMVDNKIVHTVTTIQGSAVASIPGQSGVVTSFTVSNTGNATQDYALTVANLSSGAQTIFGGSLTDNFNITLASCTVQVDGVTQGYIGSLAPDTSATVTVACPIPTGQANNDLAGVSLTAQAATAGSSGLTLSAQSNGVDNPNAIDIVFADAAGSDDIARDGKASARSAYRIVTAALTVTKSVAAVCDPLNGGTNPKSVPGAYVQYTITIVNNGLASATLTTITDVLNANVDFDPDLISGAGAAANCDTNQNPTSATGSGFKLTYTNRGAGFTPKYMSTVSDGDGATHASGTLTIDFAAALPVSPGYAVGELKQGESLQLVYQVRIK